MRTKFAFGLVAVLLGSLSTVRAAEFWEKKDYRQWSEKECRKLLRNSPWAKQYVLANPIIKNLGGHPARAARVVMQVPPLLPPGG